METHNRRRWESRRDLAELMLELSRSHTIAPLSALLPGEIDAALRAQFGRPAITREVRPFGAGASHAFNMEFPPYKIPEELRHLAADPHDFERKANELQEIVLFKGLGPKEEAEIPNYDPLSHIGVGERGAKDKEALREIRKAAGWDKGEKAKRLAKAQTLTEYLEPTNEALARAGLSADALIDSGEKGMSDFLEAVPTMFAVSEMERLRASASQKAWERQDFADLSALAAAAVHCDIVVTERFWVDVVERAKLDSRFGTIFLGPLEDLPQYLV